jgi:hypothetical protein
MLDEEKVDAYTQSSKDPWSLEYGNRPVIISSSSTPKLNKFNSISVASLSDDVQPCYPKTTHIPPQIYTIFIQYGLKCIRSFTRDTTTISQRQ